MSNIFISRLAGTAFWRIGATALALTVLAALPARAEFPDRPLRIVVPYPPGGTTDFLARAIAPRLAERLHQAVAIDNRAGAGGAIGSQLVAKSPADGYTLVFGTIASHGILPVLQKPAPYDAVKDFAPVTLVALTPNVLIANIDAPLHSVAELLAKARAQPGTVNFGSTSLGGSPQMSGELLKTLARIDIVHVPYKGIPQAVPAAIAGEVQMTFSGAASTQAHIKSGRLKPLAIGGKARLALLPDVPTFAEQGFPDVPANAWFGLFAPAATPPEIITRLHAEATRILKDPEFLQKEILAKGYELVASTPAEFAAFLLDDSRRNANAVKISGARAE